MKILRKVVFLLVFGLGMNFLFAQNFNENSILVESRYDFDKTFSILKKKIKEKELKIFGMIHHDKEAKKKDLELSKTKVFLLGNPKIGTLLMQENPKIAVDLPLKILIFEQNGSVFLLYPKVSVLQEKYKIEKSIPILQKIDKNLEDLLKYFQQ